MTALRLTTLALVFQLSITHAAGIEGDYSVKGQDPAGKTYSGKLTIKADGPVFRLTYKDGNTLRGMGIQRGDNLFAAWGPSNKCTVSALEIKADGNLEGPWGDLSNSKLGTETLKRQSGADNNVPGTFSSSGVDPDGHSYAGVTTIEARGAIYKVTFKSEGEKYDGVGVKHGNYLAVSYGGEKCGVTAYSIKGDNTMNGVYAEYGQAKAGREEMVKGW